MYKVLTLALKNLKCGKFHDGICFRLQEVSYNRAEATTALVKDALVEDWPVGKFISSNNSTILALNAWAASE